MELRTNNQTEFQPFSFKNSSGCSSTSFEWKKNKVNGSIRKRQGSSSDIGFQKDTSYKVYSPILPTDIIS
jgi:hypothetical protein